MRRASALCSVVALLAGVAVARAGEPADVSAEVRAAFDHGRALLESGRLVEAKGALEEVTAAAPQWADAWYLLGMVYTRGERWSRAIDALEKGLAAAGEAASGPDPTRAKLSYTIGVCRVRRGEGALAEEAFRAAMAADGRLGAARVELGALLAARAEPAARAEAVALLSAAVEAAPKSARARHELATAHARAGDDAAAIAAWRACLERDPDHLAARYGLGRALLRTGDAAAGREALAEYARREEAARARRLAERDLRKAQELCERAALALAESDAASALPFVQRATELAPERPEPRRMLAEILTALGRDADAAAALEQAERLRKGTRRP